jgi:L-2-hydroxyglutarate oxidase
MLVDGAPTVAYHTSTRNTGVIHRPFYLDPGLKKVFAQSASSSYPLWREVAEKFGLPWKNVGTFEVATAEEEVRTLEKYVTWGARNGMAEDELELLDGRSVEKLEPEVRCRAALNSKTDVSVDFGSFTRAVFEAAEREGVALMQEEVIAVASSDDGTIQLTFKPGRGKRGLTCRYLINSAGGGAVDIAHMCGVGLDYTDLHFRGDYWVVGEPFAPRVGRNIYSVARHSQFPFLDPHFVVRSDGSRQIGPNAALVSGPFAYEGLGDGILRKLAEAPVSPKVRLFTNPAFLSLLWNEWRSTLSRREMCQRIRRFIPGLRPSYLVGRGLSGVRSSLIGDEGFVPEALQIETQNSLHILNFNSPGATGAPAYSARVVRDLRESGALGFARERSGLRDGLWGGTNLFTS